MTYQRKLQSKLGYQHPYFYDTSLFDGNVIATQTAPSASVRAAFKIPNNWNTAYEQVPSSSYYANTYLTREHIVLHPTTEIASGERSEITYNAPGGEDNLGVTVEYIAFHLIKTGFTDDWPTNRFMLFQQWHQQASGLSPENMLAYGRSDVSTRGLQPTFGNISSVNVSEFISLTLDQWVQVKTIIKWSTGSDGFARLYQDGALKYSHDGATLTTESKVPYWKVGLYRDRAIDVEQRVTTKWVTQRII